MPDPDPHADPQAEAGGPVTARLLQFNLQLLAQALALVAAHEAPGSPAYADTVGPHLRHIIEHHEALLMPARPGVVDYDGRARDRRVERLPAVARERLLALQRRLRALTGIAAQTPLLVLGLGGTQGEFAFAVHSSFARELAFVASHAVHHYALLRAHCVRHGIAIDDVFGAAPATVAHARARAAAAIAPTDPATDLATEEPPCTPLPA